MDNDYFDRKSFQCLSCCAPITRAMRCTSGIDYLSCIWKTFRNFALQLSTLFGPLIIFDSSVTDESFVDETRVWRKYKILILVSMVSLYKSTVCDTYIT